MNNLILLILLSVGLSLSAQNKATYTYAIKGEDTLKMDVFTPVNIESNDVLPVLLWMHGGGFSGSHRAYPDDAKLVQYVATELDYIGVSIDYRLLRKGKKEGFGCDCPKEEKLETFKQAAIDYLDAAKYLVEHAQVLQINKNAIIAGGSSAGAEGILNAVFMREFFISNVENYKEVKFAGAFSCAGAVVDAKYIKKDNAVPTVLYHGTEDQSVPFGSAPHHYCEPYRLGYIILDGSGVIAKRLEKQGTSYYLHMVVGGEHEVSAIPFPDLDKVFDFFEQTVFKKEVIQTKIIKIKQP